VIIISVAVRQVYRFTAVHI